MTEKKNNLALAFIKTHPDTAASVLEKHDLDDVAEYLSGISEHDVAKLIQHMLPQYVGRLSRLLDARTMAAILANVELSFVAAVLRYLSAADRNKILAEFSTNKKAACFLLLSFTEDTVGAWLTPEVLTVPDNCLVEDALHYIKAAGEVVHSDSIFIVDRNRILKGRVNYLELSRAPLDSPVDTLMQTRCHSLSGRLSLQKAAEHPDWETLDAMPVNNRSQQFLGVLRHADLRRGLDQLDNSIDSSRSTDPLSGIIEVYGDSLLALFHTAGNVIESERKK